MLSEHTISAMPGMEQALSSNCLWVGFLSLVKTQVLTDMFTYFGDMHIGKGETSRRFDYLY
jgi:hypothetical protein